MNAHVIFIFTVASFDLFTSLNGVNSFQNFDATKVYNYLVTVNDQGVLQYFKSEDERGQPGQTKIEPQFSNPKQYPETVIIFGGLKQQQIHPHEPPQQQGPNVLPVSPSSDDDDFCAKYGKSVCISLSVAILSTFQRHQSKSLLLCTW